GRLSGTTALENRPALGPDPAALHGGRRRNDDRIAGIDPKSGARDLRSPSAYQVERRGGHDRRPGPTAGSPAAPAQPLDHPPVELNDEVLDLAWTSYFGTKRSNW